MKVALFGGSFDPMHGGHLQVALAVLRRGIAREVWFVCAMQSPFKDAPWADFNDRVALIKAMIAPYRRLKVCTIEQKLPIPSKTIHTVSALKKRYPHISFSWIIGEDQCEHLTSWFEYPKLKENIDFIGVARTHARQDYLVKTWIVMNHPATSTQFRVERQLRYIPIHIRFLMLKRGMYVQSLLRQDMSGKRFEHTCRVKATIYPLAQAHHVNLQFACVSALLHDVAKGMPEKVMDDWIARSAYAHIAIPLYAKHAAAGAMIAKHRYGVRNKKILKAIHHHSDGLSTTKLSHCLFVADKIEPQRPEWLVALKPLAYQNLTLTTTLIKKGFSDDT